MRILCLNVDPLFVDADNGNLRLTDSSPAIDAGDPLTNPLIFPSDSNGNPIDLDGRPRFFPAVGEIDIGAYEWRPLGGRDLPGPIRELAALLVLQSLS